MQFTNLSDEYIAWTSDWLWKFVGRRMDPDELARLLGGIYARTNVEIADAKRKERRRLHDDNRN